MKFVFPALLAFIFILAAGCLQQPSAFPTPYPTPYPTQAAGVTPTLQVTLPPTLSATPSASAIAPTPTAAGKLDFVSACNAKTDPAEKTSCLQSAAVKYNDSSVCETLNTSDDRYLCRGLAKSNPSVCQLIKDDVQRATCFDGVGIATRNASTCLLIPANQSSLRLECASSIAFTTQSQTSCLAVLTGNLSNLLPTCKALAAHEASLCRAAADSLLVNNCYFNVALALKDPSLCSPIPQTDSRISCAIRVQQWRDSADAQGG